MEQVIALLEHGCVRYLLIGGQAMRLHGMPRFSMDWDFFLPAADTTNFERLNSALDDILDERVTGLGPAGEGFVQTFQTRYGVVQFHLAVPASPRSMPPKRVRSSVRTRTAFAYGACALWTCSPRNWRRTGPRTRRTLRFCARWLRSAREVSPNNS